MKKHSIRKQGLRLRYKQISLLIDYSQHATTTPLVHTTKVVFSKTYGMVNAYLHLTTIPKPTRLALNCKLIICDDICRMRRSNVFFMTRYV